MAQRYLNRFASIARERGVGVVFFTTEDWPEDPDGFDEVIRLPDGEAAGFANALREAKPKEHCDLLYSFERVWECDFYRAADGVHRAWLDRRAASGGILRRSTRIFRRGNQQLLNLERSMLGPGSKTVVLANSEFVKHEIREYYEVPAERIHVVYNGYKPPALAENARSETRKELGLNDSEIMLLFAGTGWRRKGLRFAMRAASGLAEEGVRLVVIGQGSRLGLPPGRGARFLGSVPDIAPYYEAADLFVLPTLYDPFSKACLEAAAHGLPVITTTANGFSEIMLHGHQGEAVENPADVKALTAAIDLWLDPVKRASQRAEIRNWARSFRLKKTVADTLDIILAPAPTTGAG